MLVSALLLQHLIVRQKRVWSEPQNKWWLETSLDAAVQEESPELLEREVEDANEKTKHELSCYGDYNSDLKKYGFKGFF